MAPHRWILICCTIICSTNALPATDDNRIPSARNLQYQQISRAGITPPTNNNAAVPKPAVNVNETVREVELLLEKNPNLPRLTRGEILDIIDNITKSDAQREKKAIMLVMPYTPNSGGNGNIEDLYTKPPVTQIIGSEASSPGPVYKEKATRKPYVKTTQRPLVQDQPEVFVTTPRPQRLRKTTTTEAPVYTTTEFVQQTVTTQPPTVSSSTVRYTRRPKPNRGTPKYPNHKYSGEEFNPAPVDAKEGIRIVDPPKRTVTQSDPISADYWHSQKTTHPKNPKPIYQAKLVPTTGSPVMDDIVPDHLKDVVKDMDLILADHKKPYVPSKYSSQYDANSGIVKHKIPPPMKENVKDLLASIGLHPEALVPTTTTTAPAPDASAVVDSISPDMRELLRSFGLLPETGNAPIAEKPKAPKFVERPSLSPEISLDSYVSFKPLPDSAPSRDDMHAFLSGYGLGGARSQKALSAKQPQDNIKASASELNIDMIPDDFHGVLKDLGITDENGKPIAMDGTSGRTPKRIRTESIEKTQEKHPQHVFNPAEPPYATSAEMDKLEKLLNVIKKLEALNRTATQEDLTSSELENIKELTDSINKDNYVPLDEQADGPDPLSFDESSFEKNEVKRQEEKTSSSTTSSTTAAAPADVSIDTATEASEGARNPSIADLEDSFGGPSSSGSSTTEAPLPTEPPTPAPKRTGFYYLLDWNSFLDVDNQKGKRVNLRFSPRVGDPSRFLPVNVP